MVDQPLIRYFVYLQDKPQKQQARLMLRQIANSVKPIMARRGYKVTTLKEFYRKDKCQGLNRNHGEMIELRLRHQDDENIFLDFEECVGVMLHELAHNIFGPHDWKFNALLEEHMQEYAILRVSAYESESPHTGETAKSVVKRGATTKKANFKEGNLGPSPRIVNETPPKNLPISKELMGQRAIVAAYKRVNLGTTAQNTHLIFRTTSDEQDANDHAILQALQELSWEDPPESYGETWVSAAGTGARWWKCSKCTLLNRLADTSCDACGARKS